MTIKEIAKLAGVSISTVSKIVNNKADNINIETRNRVLKIVKEYNYTPYGTAKNICKDLCHRRSFKAQHFAEPDAKGHYGYGAKAWL